MQKFLRFVKNEEETILLQIPLNMKGKLLEITIIESSEEQTELLENELSELNRFNEEELQLINSMQSQLNVWDI